MFLKTQEDINDLFIKYPLQDFSIKVKEGESQGIKHSYINLFHTNFTISHKEEIIFLTDHTAEISLLNVDLTGLEEYGITHDDAIYGVYEYDKDGIEVINIFKKTSQPEGIAREFPIMLNGKWLVSSTDNLIKEREKEIQEFYDSIEEFSNHYEGLRGQLRLLDRLELDEVFRNQSQLSQDKDMLIFYSYYQQSQSDYFALQYSKLIDKDSRVFSFYSILLDAKNKGILDIYTYNIIDKGLRKISDNHPIQDYRNNYGAHYNKTEFKKYNRVERISPTGIQQTRSIVEPLIFREKLKELMDFIDKTINTNFAPQIGFGPGGGHSQQKFTLKLISSK